MIDDLHCDLAGLRRVEWLARGAVQLRPFALIDLSAQGFLQLVVGAFLRVLATVEEVGVTDEKALSVVVAVDEPAGDVVSSAAPHRAGRGVEHVHAADRYDHLTVLRGQFYVRLAEDREQVAGPRLL